MSNKLLVGCFAPFFMAIWVVSGVWSNSTVEAEEPSVVKSADIEESIYIRAVRSQAEKRTLFLEVRGQTAANRTVQVKAEVAGKVVELAGEKGRFVNKGELLCRIAEDARRAEYRQVLAEYESSKLEYDGFADLNKRGLQSEIVLAKARSALEQSKTRTEDARLALEKTNIVAPFNGVVTDQQVEVGDYLSPGAVCVSLMEVDPMLVSGQIAEKSIGLVSLESQVKIQLITGDRYVGAVSYLGHAPDENTRTYPVEVTIKNKGLVIRTGLTAQMQIPVGTESVHLISPASLVLDDAGSVGVRVVDAAKRARFMPVEVADEDPSGIWVKGLPLEVDLITVGHEEVSEGQLVTVDYSRLGMTGTLP